MTPDRMTNPTHRVAVNLSDLLMLRARARSLQLPSARRALNRRRGGHMSVLRGRGMSLAEVRPYQGGDDIRRIDWRVTARRQEPHTRVYEEERERPVLILGDLGPSLFFASEGSYKQVRCAELAALLAWVAHGSGDQAGGIVFGGPDTRIIRPSRRRHTVLQLLDAFATQQRHRPDPELANSAGALDQALTEVRRIAHTGSRVFIISDFRGASNGSRPLLSALAQHNQVTAVVISDPLDDHLPGRGDYAVAGPAGTLWFDGDDRSLQRAWRESAAAHRQALARLFRETGVDQLELATGEDPISLMHGLTSTGGRLL
ncbi:Protein of unknown function DUF58 [Marinobacter daqiaonensis]|uniref:DUF58 domain-containing protein n=1 Tax=Marinobacter daqiaonensis TaxID=650891 RepID=A0A1I6H5I7_9GAMM|nr:DUF58 domain-containing protein [Marinobacter daqiaonensis]SFR49650.1 Protein of unknown function DUF58 [Marinobacter daqiaonensis]